MTNNMSNKVLGKRLLKYIKPLWPILVVGIVGNMLYSGIDAGFVYGLKPLMDRGFIARDMVYITWIPVITVVAFGLRGFVSFMASYCMTYVARSIVMVFRQEMFAKFMRLPAKFYDNASSGQLLSKLLYDVEKVSMVSADALTTFVQSFCLVIGLFAVMFTISWRLSLLYIAVVPVIAAIVIVTNKRVRRVSKNVQESMGDVTHIAEESIEGYRVVRTFGGQQYEINKFKEATENSRRRDMKVTVTQGYNVSGVQLVAACAISVIVYFAINPNYSTMVTAGGFGAMIGSMLALLKPLKNLTTVNSTIQRGLAGVESVFELFDQMEEPDNGIKTIGRADGKIEFKNITFKYIEDKEPVLKDINLTVEPGQTVAFVGRSGSGKTTLASLLPRFYELQAGSITIDNIDTRELTLKNLRDQVALVSQHVNLFNDTIANNIAYGNFDEAQTADIENAAVAAHAMEFIKQFPDGLSTMVGENGVLLSGGQRQRLAIARAIYKDAPILILDEATSALDTESERHIQAALDEVMRNRTTLVIAHRLSTIENADKIVVIDAGEILEQGTHNELLEQNGHYARLHKMQFQQKAQSVAAETLTEAVA